jgi:hypothetical protein
VLRLRSFKLRFFDGHIHAVPATDAAGCPFGGPGCDLRGARAAAVLDAAAPLLEVLREVEPGVTVRALSIDLERGRLLATLEATTATADVEAGAGGGAGDGAGDAAAPGRRPRVVRVDAGALLDRCVEAAAPCIERLSRECAASLARRARA